MLSADSRWVCHPAYILWACNIVEAIKLQSSISIALRMRSFRDPSINHREDRRTEEMLLLTAGQLRGRLDNNPHLKLLQFHARHLWYTGILEFCKDTVVCHVLYTRSSNIFHHAEC